MHSPYIESTFQVNWRQYTLLRRDNTRLYCTSAE
jgi:hypothetical protein